LKLIKYILFGNFWSFLLILSAIVDIAIGVIILTDVLPVKGSPLPISLVCFAIGLIYLAAGLGIAITRLRKKEN